MVMSDTKVNRTLNGENDWGWSDRSHPHPKTDKIFEVDYKPLKIYLSGPINFVSRDEAILWRANVVGRLSEGLGGRVQFFDPMDRDYTGSTHKFFKEIVELDKKDIDESDLVLVNYSMMSTGTTMEIMYAYDAGKTVIAVVDSVPISPWLIYHTDRIFTKMDDALSYIEDFYA